MRYSERARLGESDGRFSRMGGCAQNARGLFRLASAGPWHASHGRHTKRVSAATTTSRAHFAHSPAPQTGRYQTAKWSQSVQSAAPDGWEREVRDVCPFRRSRISPGLVTRRLRMRGALRRRGLPVPAEQPGDPQAGHGEQGQPDVPGGAFQDPSGPTTRGFLCALDGAAPQMGGYLTAGWLLATNA